MLIYASALSPYLDAGKAIEMAQLGKKISDAVHFTQRERYPTVGFVASEGKEFSAELKKAREELDAFLTGLPEAYKKLFAKLGEIRRKVDNLELFFGGSFQRLFGYHRRATGQP